MLGDKPVIATLAVKDLDQAKSFYEGKLGLKPGETHDDESQPYLSGSTAVLVYRSQYAGTNQATAASWAVGDEFDAIIADLKSKGVSFEHYEIPGVTVEGDVHLLGPMKAVWFKDPDGNILNLVDQTM